MNKTLAVLGSINADHVISVPYFAKPGETLRGDNYHIAYGGKGANQAVAAARLGAKVDFIGCIGEQDIGLVMKKSFAEDGINVEAICEIEGETTGVAMIQVSNTGENSIVISAGANACLNEQFVEKFAYKIHQADYLLMQLETPISAVQKAAELAKQQKTKVILNPAPAQPLSDELLSLVDIITPNETETELLTGIHIVDVEDAKNAANIFHQKGICTVLITMGAKGVFVSHKPTAQQDKIHQEIIAGFSVQTIDTTAAGDTFNGGLVTALLEHDNLYEAIPFAQAAAALSVTKVGAQSSIPSRGETLDFLATKKASEK